MLKSHKKILKLSLPLRYDEMLPKCRFWRNGYWVLTGKNYGFWVLWGIFKECIKQNITMAVLRKANSDSVVICRLIKKTIMYQGEKLIQTLIFPSFWGFNKKECYVVHISPYISRIIIQFSYVITGMDKDIQMGMV